MIVLLIYWFIDLLIYWFIDLLIYWFIDLLIILLLKQLQSNLHYSYKTAKNGLRSSYL